MFTLKGNTKTTDRRLDRVVQFDEKSKKFPIRSVIGPKPKRGYSWRTNGWLDQGQEGACVGFGWSHELIARPVEEPLDLITADFARFKVYREAQKIDEWPGENYEGTSVIAGAKVIQQLGFITEYRWSFSMDELILALGYAGPAVLGINWYDGMFDPDSKGFIKPTGSVAGGHCILANSVDVKKGLIRLHNSWGKDWGVNGECFITFDDLWKVLQNDGEACIPVGRKLIKKGP